MKNFLMGFIMSLLFFSCNEEKDIQQDYRYQPVPFTDVVLDDNFWLPRIETNREVTIPYIFDKCETTGRIDNFAKAAGLMEGPFGTSYPFDDTDVAALSDDDRYSKTTDRIWEDVVGTKLYLTGGIGSRKEVEGFGPPYFLPNKTAYCETCASIANIFWNYRLFLLHGDSKYFDVLERTLYNGFLSGVALSGKEFFYPNPLESDAEYFVYNSTVRQPWYNCSCCPTSVVRFMPAIPGYIYAKAENLIYVNLFVGSSATIKLKDRNVGIAQQTNYPWDGLVKISVEPDRKGRFAVKLRLPGWATGKPVPTDLYRYLGEDVQKAELKINGKNEPVQTHQGYIIIDRLWEKGDQVEIYFPMPAQKVVSHRLVSENAGKVALERGPIVYCAEGIDNEGRVLDIVLDEAKNYHPEFINDLLNGITVVRGQALRLSEEAVGQGNNVSFMAIPYYAWANRGSGEMMVWFPTAK